jgi:hypothetical protein
MKSFLLNSQQTAQSTVAHFCLPNASFDKIGQPLQGMEDKINSPTKCTASQPHRETANGDFCDTLVTYGGDCPQFDWTMLTPYTHLCIPSEILAWFQYMFSTPKHEIISSLIISRIQ